MAAATPPAEQPAWLGEFLGQLLEAKQTGSLPDGGSGGAAPTWQGAGGALILALKAEHRRLCEATDALRQEAAEAKAALDQGSLQLQNLIYERQHYEKEIASCRGWRSAYSDEQIALIPEEEFRVHPMAAEQKLAEEGTDAHQLMLNRLRHEVAYRQEYVKQLDAIKAQRDALAADVAQKRSTVAGLEAEVGKLLAAAQAVQQQYAIKLPAASAPGDAAAAGGAGPWEAAGEPAVESPLAPQGQAAAAAAGGAGGDVAMADA
ncbi:hypothetical protein ABPG75_004323 [Micractinium tetrahymenae]